MYIFLKLSNTIKLKILANHFNHFFVHRTPKIPFLSSAMGFWQHKVQVHRWWIAPVHGRIFNPIAKFMELSASVIVPLHLISMLLFTSLLLHLKDTLLLLFDPSLFLPQTHRYILSITTDFFSFTMAAPTRKMAAPTRMMAAPTRKMAVPTRKMGLKERSSYDQMCNIK
ncbi:hypothetical protein QVD17_23260 [Tagetes erecta]|uniref:Uncharacterized protein n=1 Tax=Tagetes erecta TaxID=13708 RepID=A0AAD8KDU8_TARER|nr:hypothetical protein QVD17_23260 [Tagetes erecta]